MEPIKSLFEGRPIWMNALLVFCAYMTFIYMPFDLFIKPVAEDEEIWFGYVLTGWAAKATEPIHWAIYGGGFYGFLKMKSWMHPWAAVYVFQVAIAMAVFPWLYRDAGFTGIAVAVPFVILGVMLLRSRDSFGSLSAAGSVSEELEGNQNGQL
ncbi:MAG: hypothetical protein JJ934_11875 [Pseudomonadales bacterium]|nr:hypothetical protein [Pseudomonadales bacterium]MBO6566106.1 hypothetical protein [Pseudomonadales bacterium]MBO6596531.1 hypothetical protein [Pseudomonadales bacterium]MBO6657589.1 hypothetical protein [Pseudomonadales bacterium]MBO6703226.1 hypothetical protein [Pseudomonadales bacterium]